MTYHRWCCRILGFRVVVRGTMETSRSTLFVANHCSYSDVTILGSLITGSFVAKAEVASWPVFGTLAKLQRTVFIDRRGGKAREQRDDMIERLEAGDNLIMFPEGTSDDGNHVLPFKSALFSVAQHEFADGGKLRIQPVSIAYTRLDGMPTGRALKPYFAWYGDMDLMSHMWALAGLGVVTVEVVFHPSVDVAAFDSRKAIAAHCHETISAGVSAANSGWPSGRPLVPADNPS
ncbi:MAG: lysophospholipid acyltransferase family protein [Rhodospirillales bacterium]|nr:lysophospholipid acyltransferase family protein [Rhodospirillales bacterium]